MLSITRKIKEMWPKDRVTLCLHIGMPKTGTKAIQRFLDTNREVLAACGIMYPKCDIPDFQHAAFVKSIVSKHFPRAKFNDAVDWFNPATYLDGVIEKCRQKGCEKILMSTEFFWAAPAMQSALSYHSVSAKKPGLP